MKHSEYKKALEQRYWEYWNTQFQNRAELLSPDREIGKGVPVFARQHGDLNVIVRNEESKSAASVRRAVPTAKRHRYFGSMHSSQAVAQSVFANIQESNKLAVLSGLSDSNGDPVFFYEPPEPEQMVMEYGVKTLGETPGRNTEVDVCIDGPYRVCVECKFTEIEVGSCSRPKLKRDDKNFERDACDGDFHHQRRRKQRCSLSEVGIRYWDYLSELLGWPNDVDQAPCPLRFPYQIVRNLLAACVQDDGTLDLTAGHAVLVYDERNPCFQPGGPGLTAWHEIHEQLTNQGLLRRCTWQQITAELRTDDDLQWLTNELAAKYGL